MGTFTGAVRDCPLIPAVMKKAMDAAEQGGGLVAQMLDKAAEGRAAAGANLPHAGKNVDAYV